MEHGAPKRSCGSVAAYRRQCRRQLHQRRSHCGSDQAAYDCTVTAPVVAPAAAPPCACEATGSDSAAAIVGPVSILISSNPPLLCVSACVCAPVENVEARLLFPRRKRRNQFSCKEPSSRSTISPASNFKTLGGFDGTGDAPGGVVKEVVTDEVVEPSMAGISWAAVLAGAIASCALTLVLLSLGAGLGFSVVSPWSNSGVSATTFEIGTAFISL